MEKLGRYEIVDELGRGGCGVVYRAVDPKIGRQVAIKTIVASQSEDPTATSDLLVRLRREAQSAGALSHPNIVTVHELAEEGDTTYIVMEHVTGKNLRQVMSAGRLPDQTILSMLLQAADALDYAHSQGVVHRDVKPANFLLTERGVLKVTDFGIAKLISGETSGVTQTGMMIGTTHYMAPEQIAMTPVDGSTDQFALAVMAYEMLTGQRPFQGDSFASIIHQVLSLDPPPVEQYRESLGPEATFVLRRAMSKKNVDRYPNCTAFIRDLEAAVMPAGGRVSTITTPVYAGSGVYPTPTNTNTGMRAATAPPAPAAPAPAANRRPLIWLLAGLATIAVAFQGYRALHPATTESPAPPAGQAVPPSPPPVTATAPPAVAPPPAPEPAPRQSPPAVNTPVRRPEPAPAVTTPAVVPPPAPAPAAAPEPAVPSIPDPELPPGGRYRGPPEGSVQWSGSLASRATLVMAGNRASSGAITGRGLPVGIGLTLEVSPSEMRVLEAPSPANRYRLTLSNTGRGEVSAITIRWSEKRE